MTIYSEAQVIACVGPPKCGTHALLEVLLRCGFLESLSPYRYKSRETECPFAPWQRYCVHSHCTYEKRHELGGVVPLLIMRDPRSAVISASQYFTEKDPIKHISGYNGVPPYAETYEKYLGWYDDVNVAVIPYENLVSNPLGTVEWIYSLLFGVRSPLLARVIAESLNENQLSHNPTYRRRENVDYWKKLWTREVHEAWLYHGGEELEGGIWSEYPGLDAPGINHDVL